MAVTQVPPNPEPPKPDPNNPPISQAQPETTRWPAPEPKPPRW